MSDVMEVSVDELEGSSLDWAVAKAVGLSVTEDCGQFMVEEGTIYLGRVGHEYSPSTDWSQGGPLIERYGIESAPAGTNEWQAMQAGNLKIHGVLFGPSLLIAACRAIVASYFGGTVKIPAELVEAS